MWITKERDKHGESRERQDNNDGTNDDKRESKKKGVIPQEGVRRVGVGSRARRGWQ